MSDHAASQGRFLGVSGNVWTLILLAGGAVLTTIDFVLAFFFAPLVEGAQFGEQDFQLADLVFVQSAGDFFTVAGDERQSVAFVKQGDGRFSLLGADGELL